jgi:hypothetical protein
VLPGERSSTARARSAVNVIGTPFFALGKGTACVVTTVFAIPVAGAAQVMDRPADQDLQRQTYKTVGKVCGGRYYLGEKRQTTTIKDQPVEPVDAEAEAEGNAQVTLQQTAPASGS